MHRGLLLTHQQIGGFSKTSPVAELTYPSALARFQGLVFPSTFAPILCPNPGLMRWASLKKKKGRAVIL